MSIYDLKHTVFNDLDNPMSFLTTKGFEESVPCQTKHFGAFYFYNGTKEWFVTTPSCTVLKADVNTFKNGEHVLVLRIDDELWIETVKQKLIEAIKLAHPEMEQSTRPLEDIVKHCHFPNFKKLELRSKYKAKRSKVFQYVNMYNCRTANKVGSATEITGQQQLTAGSTVTCSLRFILSETTHEDDHIDTGIRADFGAGIRVLQLAGRPDAIKRPWDWEGVDFESLTMPMYSSVRVKTPAMQIASVGVNSMHVVPKSNFKDAINHFHVSAGADVWDEQIYTRKQIATGGVVVATVVPKRNKTRIEWTAESLHTSQKKRQKT